jgi:PKD repeat protein
MSIVATPAGSNAQTLVSKTVDIRLIPVGVILPSGPLPVARFTFAPSTPSAGAPVQFDASTSCAVPLSNAGLCAASPSAIVSYRWTFGDGGSGSGIVTSHAFMIQQSYSVTLTVTNDLGVAASTTQVVAVGPGTPPTGDFTVSPTPVNVNDTVHFNADTIRTGPGRTITDYDWNFGDGGTASGVSVTHAFTSSGTFTVVLSVTDDTQQTATFTKSVVVGTGNPTAVLTINKAGGNQIIGDGSASTAVGSATITDYRFAWGDGNTNSGAAAVVNHTYAGAGTFTVRLTVTDSLGRTGTVTQQVTVP